MDFKRYFGKIKNKNEKPKQKPETVDETEDNIAQEQESEITKQVDVNVKKTLNFVDDKKDPHEYIRRYLMESKYKDWFNRNYPNHTIYDAVGLSMSDYLSMKRELFPESETINEEESNRKEKLVNTNFKPTTTHETKTSFDEFIDERTLSSHNAFGDKEMKIKILEVSDEIAPLVTKFGDRVKINKIIAVDLNNLALKKAKKLGADKIVNIKKGKDFKKLKNLRINKSVVTTGNISAIEKTIKLTSLPGICFVMGVPKKQGFIKINPRSIDNIITRN